MAGNLLHFLPLRSRKLKLLKGIFAFLTSTLFLHFAESFAIFGLNRGVAESRKTVAVTGFFGYQSRPDSLKITLYIGFEIE